MLQPEDIKTESLGARQVKIVAWQGAPCEGRIGNRKGDEHLSSKQKLGPWQAAGCSKENNNNHHQYYIYNYILHSYTY